MRYSDPNNPGRLLYLHGLCKMGDGTFFTASAKPIISGKA
jgi:hypothetical protein